MSQLSNHINAILGLLVVAALCLSAHYLAQIRDIMRDIRDGKKGADASSRYGRK